jgi:hypothetical protein
VDEAEVCLDDEPRRMIDSHVENNTVVTKVVENAPGSFEGSILYLSLRREIINYSSSYLYKSNYHSLGCPLP